MASKTYEKSATVRIERSVYEQAEKAKQKALKEGQPSAFSAQSWYTMLVGYGLNYLHIQKGGIQLDED